VKALGDGPLADMELPGEPDLLDELAELVSGVECRVCQQSLDPSQVEFLTHHGEAWLMAAYCESCDVRQLVVVLVHERKPGGATVVVGEMTQKEWDEVGKLPPIGVEDVRRVTRLLEGHQVDLNRLLDD